MNPRIILLNATTMSFSSSEPNDNTPQKEAKRDIVIAWRLYRENWRAFVGCYGFAILSMGILIIFLVIFLNFMIPNKWFLESEEDIEIAMLFSWIFIATFTLILIVAFYAFLNSQYGLAYDIMSSGDGFAEFKSSFTYFKRFWWQYPLLTLISSIWSFIIVPKYNAPRSWNFENANLWFYICEIIIFMIWTFVWQILWHQTYPSLTAQGSLKKSFRENFWIFTHHTKRIFWANLYYSLLFFFPVLILSLITSFLIETADFSVLNYVLMTVTLIISLLSSFIGFPMFTLISTRIYNTTLGQKKK